MLSFFKYVLRRLAVIPVTLFVITAVLYAIVMMVSPEERADLYWPPNTRPFLNDEQIEAMLERIIEDHGLREPYPQQYFRWATNLVRGNWGYSPVLNGDVLEGLIRRTPVTAELTLYSVFLFIPLGLVSGVIAGWRQLSRADNCFRLTAFVATSIPPFILGLFLLSFFYVGLRWFPPGRTSIVELSLTTSTFRSFTGLLTIDGLLNGRPEVTLDAFRHLILPVITLSLTHWATLGRVTRTAIIDELQKEYIVAARARGLRNRFLIWRHAFRNALLPALTSTALSAASLVTGVFVVERVFSLRGVSELVTMGFRGAPDAPLALGFAVYSVLLVMPIMLALDAIKAIVDPRVREEPESVTLSA